MSSVDILFRPDLVPLFYKNDLHRVRSGEWECCFCGMRIRGLYVQGRNRRYRADVMCLKMAREYNPQDHNADARKPAAVRGERVMLAVTSGNQEAIGGGTV